MKYWVGSDYHFGHKDKMMELCGRPQDYQSKILSNLKTIPDDDCLIYLGDYCFGNDSLWHWKVTGNFKFKKIFVRGNHDPKSYSWYMDHGWDFSCDTLTLRIYGKMIIFSHRPIEVSAGTVNIHGHIHNKDPKMLKEALCMTPGHVLVKCEHEYRPQLVRGLVGQ